MASDTIALKQKHYRHSCYIRKVWLKWLKLHAANTESHTNVKKHMLTIKIDTASRKNCKQCIRTNKTTIMLTIFNKKCNQQNFLYKQITQYIKRLYAADFYSNDQSAIIHFIVTWLVAKTEVPVRPRPDN